ncbi:hypothetical protein [Angustibacter aerolatus]
MSEGGTLPGTRPVELELRWQPRVEDLVEAMRMRMLRPKRLVRVTVVLGLLALVAVAGVVADVPVLRDGGIGGVAGTSAVVLLAARRDGRTVWKRSASLRLEQRLVLRPDGFVRDAASARTGGPWASVAAVTETANLFVVEHADLPGRPFFVVPKRATGTATDQVRELFRVNTPFEARGSARPTVRGAAADRRRRAPGRRGAGGR